MTVDDLKKQEYLLNTLIQRVRQTCKEKKFMLNNTYFINLIY